jgi:hypothetical protein
MRTSEKIIEELSWLIPALMVGVLTALMFFAMTLKDGVKRIFK